MNKDILIFGKGFIGRRLQAAFDCAITDRKIYKIEQAQQEVDAFKPKAIINCIGHTGARNVDDSELGKDAALFTNTVIPTLLGEIAFRNNIKLIHISSGCIYHYDYNKQKPINEDLEPDYFDLYYSRTKIYAEKVLSALLPAANILMVRIRIPLDNRPHPRNILDKLIRYRRIIDVPNSITYIPDFIEALKHLIRIDARGIFNVTNKGCLRYPELMDVYKKYVPDFNYEIVKMEDVLKTPRTNLVMSVEKLEKSGFKMREIHRVLEDAVRGYLGK